MNLDGFDLPIKELKGANPVNFLYFFEKCLGPASAIVIAALISDNASLTSLDLRYNFMGGEGEALLRKAVEGRPGFKLRL